MLEIATDGSTAAIRVKGGTADGGWAWHSDSGAYEYGYEPDTTISRMELLAAIKALEWVVLEFDLDHEVRIVTDSSYVKNCFGQRWYRKWEQNGWVNSTGEPVANRDLWERLLHLTRLLKVRWVHVKGHQGRHDGNEIADDLSRKARTTRVSS